MRAILNAASHTDTSKYGIQNFFTQGSKTRYSLADNGVVIAFKGIVLVCFLQTAHRKTSGKLWM
jgi:hypothetical protein